MAPHLLPLSLAVFALAAAGSPQAGPDRDKSKIPAAAKKSADDQHVEVRFDNGSTVLMTLLEDRLEVVTDYGKLLVPTRDIRSIDFGVHLSAETRQQIDTALAQLASPNYRVREAAQQELIRLGPRSYLALKQAARTADGEAARRIQAALKGIGQKVPARLLRTRAEDRVRTAKFTIVGRIATPAIRAKAEYFGDLNLKPGQMLSLRRTQDAGAVEVTVDAARYGSARGQWMDTGVTVEAHTGLRITASGQVDLWPQGPGQYMAGPDGMQGGGVRAGGALVGRVGEGGTPFLIGASYRQTPAQAGKLYLHIVPSPWGNASTGLYTVRIRRGAAGDDED